MGLARLAQDSLAAGMVRSVARELIPSSGAWDLENFLLDSDGDAYRRGGVLNQSNADLGGAGISFLWDGRLVGGQRTVIAGPRAFGVLDSDGETPILLSENGLSRPARGSVVGGLLFIDGGYVYGGSRFDPYSTGTVAVTNGSVDVVGTGMTFNDEIDIGMQFRVTGDSRFYTVERIHGNIVLSEPYEGATGTGLSYKLTPVATASVIAPIYGVVGKRLMACSEDRVRFSEWDQPQTFLANNEHVIPGGVEILGCGSIGDTAIIFTTGGIWTIANMEFDPVDERGNVQHLLNLANPGLILWGKEGIAAWNDQLIVPGTDGIYLVGAGGSQERLDRSIEALYLDYISKGYRPGLATVYRSTYFLPILSAGNRVIDVLDCRLDRPTRSSIGTIFPWTHLTGDGANVRSYAVRVGSSARRPQLLGASGKPSSRVLNCSRYFEPDSDVADDLGEDFRINLVTRDHQTGQGNKNIVRWFDLFYDLKQDIATTPTLEAAFGVGARVPGLTEWGLFDWGEADWSSPQDEQLTDLSGTAPAEMEGLVPKRWAVTGENGRARYMRFRIRSSDPIANLRIRAYALWIRQSTKAD